jgi:endonuclease YncB( thermonuclease family)
MHPGFRVLLCLAATLAGASARADGFTGSVVGISDGDTLTVLRGRTPVKVRLHGIDAVRRVI